MYRLNRGLPPYWVREKSISNQHFNYQHKLGLNVREKLCNILMPNKHYMAIALWIN